MKSKIALVLGTNIHWAPFYYRYEKILIEKGIPFDLIIWNREGMEENNKASKVFEFNAMDRANNKNPLKVWKFIGFSAFVKKIIKGNNYDKLIFVGTYGCAVCFCASFLSKNYSQKMWIDIRDDLYEWFKPYYLAEKKSIESSFVTTISSHKYKSFLPEHNYYLMHNIDPNAASMVKSFKHKMETDNVIRISFIGNVRYYQQNKQILDLLKNDFRFKLQYYGKGSEELKQYCEENSIKNVDFYGRFPQEDTVLFYEKTDIINNVYGNDSLNLQTALSNKLYYSVLLELPILVSANTYMEEISKEYNIGFTFENEASFSDKLYKWYMDIREGRCTPMYKELWQRVENEDKECMAKLDEFIRK